MNLRKLLLSTALTTILITPSFSQFEKYSLSLGGSFRIPKKELRQDFNILKGIEASFEKPINEKFSIGTTYYSGYKWGKQKFSTRELEPKINAEEFSLFYKHRIGNYCKIKPFYKLGIGYEKFKLEENKNEKRLIEKINGETLNLEIGTQIELNKKNNKELYLSIKKEFFIPNLKTEEKYSNIQLNLELNFKKFSK
jgi:hypothetical protein